MSPDVKKRLLKVRVTSSQPAAPHVRSAQLLDQGFCQLATRRCRCIGWHMQRRRATAILPEVLSGWRCGVQQVCDGRLRTCDLGPEYTDRLVRVCWPQLLSLSLTPPLQGWTAAGRGNTRTETRACYTSLCCRCSVSRRAVQPLTVRWCVHIAWRPRRVRRLVASSAAPSAAY